MTEQVIRFDVPSFKEQSTLNLLVKMKTYQYIMIYTPDYSQDDAAEISFTSTLLT